MSWWMRWQDYVDSSLRTHNPATATGSQPCNRPRCKICPIHPWNLQFLVSLNYSTADEEHSVFVRKLHYYIFFPFISTSYDAHLRTRRRQSSVLGKCRSVPPSIFINFSIQGVTGPHRQSDRDDRPSREDHFLWRNMYLQTCCSWVMRMYQGASTTTGTNWPSINVHR